MKDWLQKRYPPGRRHDPRVPRRELPLFSGFLACCRYQRPEKTKALQTSDGLKGCTQFSWPFALILSTVRRGDQVVALCWKPTVSAKRLFSKAGLLTSSPIWRPSHNGHPLQWHGCQTGSERIFKLGEVTAAGPFPIHTRFPIKRHGTLLGFFLSFPGGFVNALFSLFSGNPFWVGGLIGTTTLYLTPGACRAASTGALVSGFECFNERIQQGNDGPQNN